MVIWDSNKQQAFKVAKSTTKDKSFVQASDFRYDAWTFLVEENILVPKEVDFNNTDSESSLCVPRISVMIEQSGLDGSYNCNLKVATSNGLNSISTSPELLYFSSSRSSSSTFVLNTFFTSSVVLIVPLDFPPIDS